MHLQYVKMNRRINVIHVQFFHASVPFCSIRIVEATAKGIRKYVCSVYGAVQTIRIPQSTQLVPMFLLPSYTVSLTYDLFAVSCSICYKRCIFNPVPTFRSYCYVMGLFNVKVQAHFEQLAIYIVTPARIPCPTMVPKKATYKKSTLYLCNRWDFFLWGEFLKTKCTRRFDVRVIIFENIFIVASSLYVDARWLEKNAECENLLFNIYLLGLLFESQKMNNNVKNVRLLICVWPMQTGGGEGISAKYVLLFRMCQIFYYFHLPRHPART